MSKKAFIGGVDQNLDGPSLVKLIDADGDTGILRPFNINDGQHQNKSYIAMKTGKIINGKPERKVHRIPYNAALLPHETWLQIDQTVEREVLAKLRAVDDLRSAGLVYNVPNGFAVQALMTQRASRVGTAYLGMDPQEQGGKDRVVFDTVNLPMPCIWSNWGYGARELAVSKRGGLPMDMAGPEDAARACALLAEQMLIGNSSYDQYTYLSGTIYGYTDFGSRITFHLTEPDEGGWTPATMLVELLAGKQDLITAKKEGPYVLYVSPNWSQYLDDDYNSDTSGQTNTITLRERILKIPDFREIRELTQLTGWDILIVQMETATVREVIGMEFTPVNWEEQGGQVLQGRIIGIYVPQIRSDYEGNCGIAHGNTSYT
jgi:hypothetical protein